MCAVRCGSRPCTSRCMATCFSTRSDGKCHPGQPSHLPPGARISAAECPCCPVPRDLPPVRDPSAPPQGGWAAVASSADLDTGVLIRAQRLPPGQGRPTSNSPSPGAGIPSGPHVHWVRQAFPVQRGSGHSQPCWGGGGRWGAWGEPPVSGASTPGQEEPSLSLPALSPSCPPLDPCRELLIEFTLVKNVNKLQMTS